MIKLDITAQDGGQYSKEFNSQAELDAYISSSQVSGHWGNFTYIQTDISAQVAQEKINQDSRDYLASTDYVVIKLAEAQVEGQDISALKTQYADVLTKRAQARGAILP